MLCVCAPFPRLLSRNPIAESYERQSQDDARHHVGCKAHDVARLQHLDALIGKGREGGESTAHARREQQAPRTLW